MKRRLGRLVAAADDDPSRSDLQAFRADAARVVSRLARREQSPQRQAREAVRRTTEGRRW